MGERLKITETVLRDGHQSLIATRLKLEDILPILNEIDEVGYFSVEMWGGATFDSCIRFLKEDPWERARKIKDGLKKTKTQMLIRGQNLVGYRHYSDDVVESFIKKAVDNGIDIFRIFDALNDLRNLEKSISTVKKLERHAQGAISYTVSPVHTLDFYVEMAKRLYDMGCDSICIKDMAGLLTPYTADSLVRAIKSEVPLPLQLHSHCTSGMAEMSYLKAIEAGVDGVDTAISSFASATSQPATEAIVMALKGTARDTGLDLVRLYKIASYFKEVRQKYLEYESSFRGVDTSVLVYQIPGGMLSNFDRQLKEQKALDKYDEVLEEVPRVREELGYPPLVTPTSQIVGTQAVVNVLLGKYKIITEETRKYLLGYYGKPPGPISGWLLQKVIKGGVKPIEGRPADYLEPELERAKQEIGDLAKSEEDLLIYTLFPQSGREFLEYKYGNKG